MRIIYGKWKRDEVPERNGRQFRKYHNKHVKIRTKMITPQLHTFDSLELLLEEMAAQSLRILQPSGNIASIALTGGRTARSLYQKICETALDIPVRWRNVHFFWGDERCVPLTDEESNFKLARESLLTPLRIHPSNIHPIPVHLSPVEAAAKAESDYRKFLQEQGADSLRLVLLSMGEDGHIASIFPDSIREAENSPLIYRSVTAVKPPPQRITLNYSPLVQAKQVLVIAVGTEKRQLLSSILDKKSNYAQLPLARLIELRSQNGHPTDLYTV